MAPGAKIQLCETFSLSCIDLDCTNLARDPARDVVNGRTSVAPEFLASAPTASIHFYKQPVQIPASFRVCLNHVTNSALVFHFSGNVPVTGSAAGVRLSGGCARTGARSSAVNTQRCEISSDLVDEPRQIVQEFRRSAGSRHSGGGRSHTPSSRNAPGTGTPPEV